MNKTTITNIAIFALLLAACENTSDGSTTGTTDSTQDSLVARDSNWVEYSHGNKGADSLAAFPDSVRIMTIQLEKTAWDSIINSLSACGSFGSSINCSSGDMLDMIDNQYLAWVPCTILADGYTWNHVGIRLKGNSSLSSAWSSGSYQLPFRITMDKFESQFPSITNQRFYGYKKLSLFNNMGDNSYIREKVASQLFRSAAVPAPNSGLVKVILVVDTDTLANSMYSMAEVPDAPLLKQFFSSTKGNLYKPLSALDSFVLSEFEEDSITDYSDVQELIHALNDSTSRLQTPSAWRSRLEAIFNVDGFLRWLAVNTSIANWDAYGQMAHNYYLYNDKGVLNWIAWDLGLSFNASTMAGQMSSTSIWYNDTTSSPGQMPFDTTMRDSTMMPPDSAGADSSHAFPGDSSMMGGGGFDLGNSGKPLITNLLNDTVYCNTYARIMDSLITQGPLTADNVANVINKYNTIVQGTGAIALSFDMATQVSAIQNSLATGNGVCNLTH